MSNIAGAVLACVAWAASSLPGTLPFEERFFASYVAGFVAAIGLIKDEVHRAIVDGIATTAMALAADLGANPRPIAFEKIPTAFGKGASGLPRTIVSLGVPLPGPIGVVGLLIPSGMATVQ